MMSQTLSALSSGHETTPTSPAEEKSYTLLLRGQTELVKRNLDKGCRLFLQACELKPNDPKIYCEQGLSLFEFGTEEGKEKTLLLANKKFKTATTLLPEYFEAWFLWGVSLAHLGKTYKEHHYFLKSDEKLKKAQELSAGKASGTLADLYWESAQVKVELATSSKEAHDWHLAIADFETSASLITQTEPEFWNQFGLACFSLADQINDIRLYVKTVHNFKQAINLESNNYEGWRNLSLAMSFLYESTHDEDHFSQANECFATCAQLHPLEDSLWIEWARFLCRSGRNTCDIKRLQSAVEKCTKANLINNKNPLITICWGEALALIGEFTEKVEYIHEGQNKILDAVEMLPKLPEAWRSLGETFVSMGKYFDEYDYIYQAIEKFQQGLSLDRTCHELWFSMAKAYTFVSIMVSDIESLEKANSFYLKAINLNSRSSYYRFEYAHNLSKLGELTQEEQWLEAAVKEFETALHMQKNAVYLHPDWLFQYAKTLDLYAEFFEEEAHYQKAVEIFSHVLMIDPDFPQIHYHLALAYSHLGELSGEMEPFYRALHHFKLALKHEEENDQILVDLSITLINISQNSSDPLEVDVCYRDAEIKLTQAIKSGNLQAYYQMACLFSLLKQPEKSLAFLAKTDSFNALPTVEEILEDEWLDHVRCSDAFQTFLQYLEEKSHQHEEL